MKAITIKNLVIQADAKNISVDEANKIIEAINTALFEANLNCQPQIMSSGLDSSDIEEVE